MRVLGTRQDVVIFIVRIDPVGDAVGHRRKVGRHGASRLAIHLRHGDSGSAHGIERFAGELTRFHQGLQDHAGIAQAALAGIRNRRHHGVELAFSDAGGIPGQFQGTGKLVRFQLTLHKGLGHERRNVGRHLQHQQRPRSQALHGQFRQAGGIGHLAQAILDLSNVGVQAAFANLGRGFGKAIDRLQRLEQAVRGIAAALAHGNVHIGRHASRLGLRAYPWFEVAKLGTGFLDLIACLFTGGSQVIHRLRPRLYLCRINGNL
ncbi:hypothetical protein D3C72_1497690 [compost metagenome]